MRAGQNLAVAGYIARWRPSSVSPQAAAFARDVISQAAAAGAGAGQEPAVGGGQARRLRGRAGPGGGAGGAAAPVGQPSGSPGARRACPAVARRTLRTNLRFIGRRVVPQLYPADLPLPRERSKAALQPGGDRRVPRPGGRPAHQGAADAGGRAGLPRAPAPG